MHMTPSFARRLSAVVLCAAFTLGLALPATAAGVGSASPDGSAWFGATFVQWVQALTATLTGGAGHDEKITSAQDRLKAGLEPDGTAAKANEVIGAIPTITGFGN